MKKENTLSAEKSSKSLNSTKIIFFSALVAVVALFFMVQTHLFSYVVKSGSAGKVVNVNVGAYPKTLQDAILTDQKVWLYVDHGYIRAVVGQELALTTYDSGLIRACATRDVSECAYVRRTCIQDAKTQLPGACVNALFPITQKIYQGWVRPLFTFIRV